MLGLTRIQKWFFVMLGSFRVQLLQIPMSQVAEPLHCPVSAREPPVENAPHPNFVASVNSKQTSHFLNYLWYFIVYLTLYLSNGLLLTSTMGLEIVNWWMTKLINWILFVERRFLHFDFLGWHRGGSATAARFRQKRKEQCCWIAGRVTLRSIIHQFNNSFIQGQHDFNTWF